MPDADVEPEPCRECMTPIPPGFGLCAECEKSTDALVAEGRELARIVTFERIRRTLNALCDRIEQIEAENKAAWEDMHGNTGL